MKKVTFPLVASFLLFASVSSLCIKGMAAPTGFKFYKENYETQVPFLQNTELRVGIYLESLETSLKACVFYLEGLGDSIANHEPLFKALSSSGYRILAYDYMGQGGSAGRMNSTRIQSSFTPSLEIGTQARYVWDKYTQVRNDRGQDCRQSKKFVIGWSTGGLAAYKLARDEWADAVVLVAPGIAINVLVGEAAEPSVLEGALKLLFKQVISERTLTSNNFKDQVNPHVDPVRPGSPMQSPDFAVNLLTTSVRSHSWKIPSQVKGLVFLSGKNDTYIDAAKTGEVLSKNAPHFSVVNYPEALHEIDNEVPEIAQDFRLKTVQFFDQSL